MIGDHYSTARLESDRLYRERGGEYTGGIARPRARNWRRENGPQLADVEEKWDGEQGADADGDDSIW